MSKEIFYVFLSYNTKDGDQVEKIAKFLKGRKIKVWLDKWKVQPGKSLQEALEDGLRRSNVILIFFGKYGVGQWQKEEAKIAIHQAINTGKKVIPIMLPGCPGKPEIPEFLKDKMQIDFRKGLANPEEQENLLWGITGKKTYLENDDVNEKIEKIDTIAKKKIEELKKKHRSPLITLADALSKRNLVLVIGTGINKITGIPTVAELNKPLFKDLDLDVKGEETGPYDPLYIAELYEQEFGQQRLMERWSRIMQKAAFPSFCYCYFDSKRCNTYFS